jgi:hypothetical protein
MTGSDFLLAESDIIGSPEWFPLRVANGGVMTMLRLDEDAYAAASFLDERLLALNYQQAICSLATVGVASAQLAPRCHYVLHTGHVGSTLISRLIGAHRNFFSLREPALLRAVATDWTLQQAASSGDAATALPGVLALLARTWRPTQRAVIKTTSIANELAESILAGSDHPAAIALFASPLNYLRGIFGGPNSRVESRAWAPLRLRRLVRRLGSFGSHLEPRSEGEEIAMNWLCEMTCLYQAALRFPSQVVWIDFDAFLGAPLAGMQAIFKAFSAVAPARDLEEILAGPILQQYSKAPEHAYDAELRKEVLMSAECEHAMEIRRGLAWLGQVAMQHPLAHAVLESAAR